MILGLSRGLVLEVARHMRAIDRREIFATRWEEPSETAFERIADESLLANCGAVIATLQAPFAPVAVVAAKELWPRVYGVAMFATDRWLEVALQACRYIKRELIPELRARGAIRAECHSLADHRDAHAFLEYLGAAREAVVLDFGKNGESFIRYAWRSCDRADLRPTPTGDGDVLLQQPEPGAAAA